ncbi:hypothetical protein ALP11_05386, partial [Pseudomonas syringae pv. papulans]
VQHQRLHPHTAPAPLEVHMSIYTLRMFTLTGVILLSATGMANAASNSSAQSTSREQQSALLDSQSQSSDE